MIIVGPLGPSARALPWSFVVPGACAVAAFVRPRFGTAPLAILLLLASGYWMLFTTFGGFAGAGMYIHLMQMIGWLMIALFVWLFHGPWLAFKRAVDVEDWPSAGAFLNRIRQIIAVNLPLGLLVVVTGGSGRYWG